jgi:nucleoside transport protein
VFVFSFHYGIVIKKKGENDLKFVLFLPALIIIFLLAYIVSNNKKGIKLKPIGIMLILQLVFAFLLLNTEVGLVIIRGISSLFDHLLKYAAEGINFVFGGIANEGAFPFFLNVLLPIVFISVLIGIAQYIRILPIIIRYLGLILSKVNGLGKLESYNAVASAVFGQLRCLFQ